MNEIKTISEKIMNKTCTAFYPETLLAMEHELIKASQARGWLGTEERLAYIDGIMDAFSEIFNRMHDREDATR